MQTKENAKIELRRNLQNYTHAIAHPNLYSSAQQDTLLQAIEQYVEACIKDYALEITVAQKPPN